MTPAPDALSSTFSALADPTWRAILARLVWSALVHDAIGVETVVTFEESGGKTTLTLEGYPLHASGAERKAFERGIGSMQRGFAGTLDQLAGHLAGAGS